MEENYRETHKKTQKEISLMLTNVRCTDRMINNVTVLCTIFQLAASTFKFPFGYEHLKHVLFDVTRRQNEKRDTGEAAGSPQAKYNSKEQIPSVPEFPTDTHTELVV